MGERLFVCYHEPVTGVYAIATNATKVRPKYAIGMTGKQRLSASVDSELLEAAQTAVQAGRADSVSAWVNDALVMKAEHDRRMQALDTFLAGYEAKHGTITETEMEEAARRARGRATVVRSNPVSRTSRSRSGAKQ